MQEVGVDTSPWRSLLLLSVAPIGGRPFSFTVALRRRLRRAIPAGVGVGLCAVLLAACGGGGQDGRSQKPIADDPVVEDPGPVHVHGLGVDPGDDSLFIATHTGLFRAAKDERKATRVAGRYQDTMAFTVVGAGHFMGSGHPDGRDKLPPFLGLIESRDGGETWRPISLQGKVDFHLLEVSGRSVYGFGSDFETREPRFMASGDRGKRWGDRKIPEPLVSVAVDPRDAGHLIAAGESGLHVSRDAGAGWRPLGGRPGLLAWTAKDELYLVSRDGEVSVSRNDGGDWKAVGSVGGPPAAFDSTPRGRLLAALHDGTIKQSKDGGVTWQVRSTP